MGAIGETLAGARQTQPRARARQSLSQPRECFALAKEFMIESVSKKLRLVDRDYSAPGWYFVTLGANFHKPLFGSMEESKVVLNEWGWLVVKAWHDLPNHYVDVQLGEFIVMPNHVHGLIRLGSANKLPLGTIMNGFKGQVTRNVNKLAGRRCTVWQQNYHEVIVHGLDELKAKAAYIKENPVRWHPPSHTPRYLKNRIADSSSTG